MCFPVSAAASIIREPAVDVVVIGEGEQTIINLMNGLTASVKLKPCDDIGVCSPQVHPVDWQTYAHTRTVRVTPSVHETATHTFEIPAAGESRPTVHCRTYPPPGVPSAVMGLLESLWAPALRSGGLLPGSSARSCSTWS